jgi:hypothetical protein
MFVAGRTLQIDGVERTYGQPVPEAQSWLPHILKAHVETGALLDVDNARAMEMIRVAKRHEEEANAHRLESQIADNERNRKTVGEKIKQVEDELARLCKESKQLLVDSERLRGMAERHAEKCAKHAPALDVQLAPVVINTLPPAGPLQTAEGKPEGEAPVATPAVASGNTSPSLRIQLVEDVPAPVPVPMTVETTPVITEEPESIATTVKRVIGRQRRKAGKK